MPDTVGPSFVFAAPEWIEETSSTNDLLKKRITGGEETCSGSVVAALRQTKGRGRMGNVWQSSMGGDLTFSFIWAGNKGLEEVGTLPLACGLAVLDFLSLPQFNLRCLCKWPNDVLVDGVKICGILTEAVAGADGKMHFIVGIGVNLRSLPDRDAVLGRSTADLESLTGRVENPILLLPLLLDCLAVRITTWQQRGFAGIRPALEDGLWGIGQTLTAKTPTGPMTGIMAGLGDKGELLLRDAGGRIVGVSSVAAIINGT